MTKDLANRAYVIFNPKLREDSLYEIVKTAQDAGARVIAFGSRLDKEMSCIVEGTTQNLVSRMREYGEVSAIYTGSIPQKDIEHFPEMVARGARVWNSEYGPKEESPLSEEERRTLEEALRVGCYGE